MGFRAELKVLGFGLGLGELDFQFEISGSMGGDGLGHARHSNLPLHRNSASADFIGISGRSLSLLRGKPPVTSPLRNANMESQVRQ